MPEAYVREPVLRELIALQSGVDVRLLGQRGGFTLTVSAGETSRTLSTARGQPRVFASLNTAALYLLGIGVERFKVDAAGFLPARLRKARPDRAAALRLTRTLPRQDALL